MIRRTTVFAVTAIIGVALIAGCGGSSSDDQDNGPTTSLAPAQQWDPSDGDSTGATPPAEPTTPPAAATTLPADARGVDRHDAAAVATTAVRLWFTWNTASDASPLDAVARTAPLLAPTFRDASLSSAAISPGGTWLRWANDSALVTPTIRAQPNQGAPESADRKYFIFDVTQTGHDARGDQSGASVQHTVWVICTRTTNGSWEVSQLAEQD